ncbi:hybrid sensor histidine kinase/response regulator [Pseudomonas protegens]|uniref:response regulator n=1 Tax=Pseudomonas protegens TaxID=380021 RepID=UPI000D8A192A|nr:response regulator [Pseudomonas protegens]PYC08258.1 hybrid sensor histidine kinase/response regulator [Pseudomonas protegens]
MIEALLSPSGVITLLVLLLASWLNQARLYRQRHSLRQQSGRLEQSVAALETGKRQAEEANRCKIQFLGCMSHEIRTPLNAFIGLLELILQRTRDHPQNHASLELALGAARDLRELLGDLLDISRLESGHLQLNPTWSSLRGSVDGVMGVFQALARQKNLDLSLEFKAPEPEPLVLIDTLRFKQVLANLLSNAIKFTHQGAVLVRLQLQPTMHEGHYKLLLQVLDTGIGIPREERQRLLQPFAQVDPHSQSPRDSTGLGLPISQQLCQQMGGKLSLHGRRGPGSEVRVELPLAGREGAARASPAPVPQANRLPLDILLADDHHASLTLLQEQLEYLGHRVTCVGDGVQAYEQWQEGDFDLLIVDCNMPLMNGYQLAETIRRHEALQQRPPVTLLGCSASDDTQTIQRCMNAGMHDCLLKPLDLNLLSQTLETLKALPRADSFSISTLRTLTRNQPLLALRMLKTLLQCCREDRLALGLIPAGDSQALAALAHKIKGSAKMLGATSLLACCEALERVCQDNAGIEACSAASNALDRALLRFTQSLLQHLDQHRQRTPAATCPAVAPEASWNLADHR